jgi:hypothetical protein
MAAASTDSAPSRRDAAGQQPAGVVLVDAELAWVVRLPELELGSACAPSAAALAYLSAHLDDRLESARQRAWRAELLDAAARIVAHLLSDLPELPYIGEPFGGEEGTD